MPIPLGEGDCTFFVVPAVCEDCKGDVLGIGQGHRYFLAHWVGRGCYGEPLNFMPHACSAYVERLARQGGFDLGSAPAGLGQVATPDLPGRPIASTAGRLTARLGRWIRSHWGPPPRPTLRAHR